MWKFHPTFAGAVFHDANNAPPWAVSQVKREYLDKYESARSKVDFGRPEIVLPDDLLDLWDLGWTQKSLRALLYIKEKYPPDVYHTAILYLFNAFWTKPRRRIRDAPTLAETLAEIPKGFHPSGESRSTDKLFSADQVKEIMAAQQSQNLKENLKLHTTRLGDRGAFGLPWFEVRSSEGREEPFWGSDRSSSYCLQLKSDLISRGFETPVNDGTAAVSGGNNPKQTLCSDVG
ncbi:hypothetical protein FDECE_4645 [Fusarium decemcellulare]|nr:hypothetical protein FDECE_4645 [Fusarium decemcellulare]